MLMVTSVDKCDGLRIASDSTLHRGFGTVTFGATGMDRPDNAAREGDTDRHKWGLRQPDSLATCREVDKRSVMRPFIVSHGFPQPVRLVAAAEHCDIRP